MIETRWLEDGKQKWNWEQQEDYGARLWDTDDSMTAPSLWLSRSTRQLWVETHACWFFLQPLTWMGQLRSLRL